MVVSSSEDVTNYFPEGYFEKSNGSYLLNELEKLAILSKESVDRDDDKFSFFKDYMHVDRNIQDVFLSKVNQVIENNETHLILLCGSVGDGKSHLLSYFNTTYSQHYDKFKVYGDASESNDAYKTSIDQLATEILVEFNDSNLDKESEQKNFIILAINLGILNKFLDSEYVKNDFKKFKRIIENSNIFNQNDLTIEDIHEKISIISFSDYNLFDFDLNSQNKVKSEYISALFSKISSSDERNPFYAAYEKDKKEGFVNSFIYNYMLFCNESVQEIIIFYLIKGIVKYKRIISTREILNFIYDILVPSQIQKANQKFDKYIINFLPNLLFNDLDPTDLTYLIKEFDPTLLHIKELDDFIVKLNTKSNFISVINEYINLSEITFLESYLIDLKNNSGKLNTEIIITLIRLTIFFGKDFLKNKFLDKNFIKFIEYLYYYNTQDTAKYKDLISKDIRKAIFNFKDLFNEVDYICIDKLDNFKIYKPLELNPRPNRWSGTNDLENIENNKFKLEIEIPYEMDNGEKISLFIDFLLYEYLIKINKGYKLNQTEKDDLSVFNKFINTLIRNHNINKLKIKNLISSETFIFKYNENDEFEPFIFER